MKNIYFIALSELLFLNLATLKETKNLQVNISLTFMYFYFLLNISKMVFLLIEHDFCIRRIRVSFQEQHN